MMCAREKPNPQGDPVATSKIVRHSRHTVTGNEASYLNRVLAHDDWTGGKAVSELVESCRSRFGFRVAQAASSGTAALAKAIRSLELKDKNKIVMPTYVCREVMDAVFMAGAHPVLADVDPITGQLTRGLVRRVLRPSVGAVIVADLFGHLADVEEIADLGLPVVEDAAQSIGAQLANGDTYAKADFVVFSFHGTKMISSGEGGLVATCKPRWGEKLLSVDYHERFSPAVPLRISTLGAALGLIQLRALDRFVERRRELVAVYDDKLAPLNLRVIRPRIGSTSAWYRYVVQVDQDIDALIDAYAKHGIAARKPVNRLLHRFAGAPRGDYPGAESAFGRNLSLPLYPSLTSDEQSRVIDVTLSILSSTSA